MAVLPVEKRAAVILLVNSGMRRGELFNLEWPDVDLLKGVAWITKTKGVVRTGTGRWVRLTPEMVELLKIMPRHEKDRRVLWQFTGNALTVAFKRAVRKAGLENLRLHDLRHTFATEIRKAGHGIDLIAQLLGHADLRQSQIYTHIGREDLDEAAKAIEGKFGEKIH